MMRVTVVGGGVIGLTSAVRLAEAGHQVTVRTAGDLTSATSAVAGAIWYPYLAFPRDAVTRWATRAREVFAEHATDPTSGVYWRRGREVFSTAREWPWWAEAVDDLRRCRPDELDPGHADGWTFTAPIADMGSYLPWLAARAAALGVSLVQRPVASLADPYAEGAEFVVNCTGLASRELADDNTVRPVRGQVVRLANPGLTDWLLYDDHPDGVVYVFPRDTDVVCGGTAVEDAEDRTVDDAVTRAILERCVACVPALAGAPITSVAVGLRPYRPTVRLERVDTAHGPLVHSYGHGGAGMTLSWGCAEEVAELVT